MMTSIVEFVHNYAEPIAVEDRAPVFVSWGINKPSRCTTSKLFRSVTEP